MKNVFYLFLIFMFLGCATKNSFSGNVNEDFQMEAEIVETSKEFVFVDAKINEIDTSLQVEVINHSFLSNDNVGESIVIFGELAFEEDVWILVENPNSKSRVSFVIENYMDFEYLLLERFGKTVKIVGVLTEADETWKKVISICSVE